jgi:hypothetical protein
MRAPVDQDALVVHCGGFLESTCWGRPERVRLHLSTSLSATDVMRSTCRRFKSVLKYMGKNERVRTDHGDWYLTKDVINLGTSTPSSPTATIATDTVPIYRGVSDVDPLPGPSSARTDYSSSPVCTDLTTATLPASPRTGPATHHTTLSASPSAP